MKKILFLGILLFTSCSTFDSASSNSLTNFSGDLTTQVNKVVDLENEVYAASKENIEKNGYDLALNEATATAKKNLKQSVKAESLKYLKTYLEESNLKGPGFDNSQMSDFADEVAKDLVAEAELREEFETANEEVAVIYTVPKYRIEEESKDYFYDRLDKVINKLEEYKNEF